MASRIKDIEAKFFTPRDYQLELLNRAVHHNTICSLGTGSGKTFIAVLLIKEYSFRLLHQGEKAIFLVDKVALVEQQASHIECHCSLSVGRMHGKLNTGWKTKEEFITFLNKHNVIVATAQVFLDLLNHAFFVLTQAAVIIFDECHHSLGRRHPYRLILDRYRDLHTEQRCRILGLTASVLNKKVVLPRLQITLSRLEQIMCSYLEPVNDLTTMLKYGAKPLQIVAVCSNDTFKDLETRTILHRLLQFVNNNCEFGSEIDVDPRPPIREAINRTFSVLDQVGSWCAWKVCIAWQKRITKFIEDPILGLKQKRFLNAAETAFRLCTKTLGDQVHGVRSYEKLLPFVNNRMRRLLEILLLYEPTARAKSVIKDPMFGLIFVEQRYVAYVINILLKMLAKWEPKEFGFIKADFVVGHSGTFVDTDEANAAHKRQESVLQKFRNGALNLLVCTNVLEEGVDVRQCNLVVRYDPPTDFRSFVQSRGRARKENSTFCILTSETECWRIDEELRVYAQIEEFFLKRYKCEDSPIIIDGLMENNDEVVPPYVVESTKARVSMSNAIALINRYCSKLPSDVFTRLVPQIKAYPTVADGHLSGYQAELVFPINSPVKEIISLSRPASTKAHALMAVALKGCQILHEKNELNDHLLPMGKDTVANLLSELDDEDLPYISMKTGSVKKRRLYDRKMSKYVLNTLPQPNVPCYVYLIEMKLTKPISEEGNPKKRRILDPSQVDSSFGFLSTKCIPVVPSFPVFQRQGEMEVRIQKTNSMISLTEEEMHLVELFHIHVFEDILRVARGGVEFAPEHSPIPLLVVPLKKVRFIEDSYCVEDYQLDHKNLSSTIREPPTIPSNQVRQQFKFDEAKFFDAVVMPWYRSNEQFAYYYVAEICRNQNPSTGFPDEKFSSFNQYFKTKYQLEIYDQKQNLLDVDHTSARMNLLLPRISSSRNTKKYLDPSQRQVLVPELVHIHPLSSPLWTMLIALPTIMYRMNCLLLADELRCRVMSEAFGVQSEIPESFQWEKLEYTTINSENNQQPIKNLDHLKRIISAEKEKESPSKASLNISMQSENDEEDERMDTGSFCIGVWDPDEAAEFQNPDPILYSTTNVSQPMGDEAISESIAMGSNYSIHNFAEMSDEEEDEEAYNILLDLKMTMHEKLAHLKEPFEPCEVVGWDEELSSPKFEIENVQFPLAISGNSNEINVASLMKDLETNLGRNTFENGARTKNGNLAVGSEKRTHRKKMYLDSMEAMDDADRLPHRKQKEEVVDLTEFDEADSEDRIVLETRKEEYCVESSQHKAVPAEALPTTCVLTEFLNAQFIVSAPELSWMKFSFEHDFLDKNPFGVSPSLLLQALTTSSAADGINLERLETIGDSFLKLAVTNYLYHMHADQHEGKLSFARSKEVSNSRLFNLGKRRKIPFLMEASKFDPHVNWLPPCYASTTQFHALNPVELEENDELQGTSFDSADTSALTPRKGQEHLGTGWGEVNNGSENYKCEDGVEIITFSQSTKTETSDLPPLPYNMLTQQYVSDKSIADCVEALIGAHLVTLGPRPALKFMNWLGVKVLTKPLPFFQPLLRFIDTEAEPDRSKKQLYKLYVQFKLDQVEEEISYQFGNKAYLLQAFTHASYYKNQITGCYQRLEFLGDAVLDYLITRFLYEHEKQYSPGVLTDLRSALVNNTIFASLAVKFNFHKHFIAICPGLYHMIEKFVNLCNSKTDISNHCTNFDDEMFMITEDEIDEGHEEDIEVPKALGDIFESIAGAVYLDCGMNLDIVWRVFYNLMKESIQECCKNPPQSPIRELFERKNCKARFTKLERILETGKVRVTVDVNDMRFVGMGRSYRIAKCTAAKRALKHLRALDSAKNLSKK